jgi:hypothetical protein
LLIGATGAAAVSEEGFVKGMGRLHAKVHDGSLVSVSGEATLQIAETYEMLIQTGDEPLHIHWAGSALDDTDFQFYEGTTFSAAGTTLTPVNHNRIAPQVFNHTVTHTPTLTADGTELFEHHMSAGFKIGGSMEGVTEMILATQTTYLLRWTSNANSNVVSWQIYMYSGETT